MKTGRIYRVAAFGLLVSSLGLINCVSDEKGDDDVTLKVTLSGTGTGTVSDNFIACPGDCTGVYSIDDLVTLSEEPAVGSVFGEWSGDCEGTDPAVTFVIDRVPQCDARFDLIGAVATLTVTIDSAPGSTGKVTATGIDCGNGGSDCSETYPVNTTVRVTVTSPGTSQFLGWAGDCNAFASTLQVDIPLATDRNCTARFGLTSGGIQARGSFTFPYRVEAGALKDNTVIVAGYDNTNGHVIDVSNIQVLSSPNGPEFNTCLGARSGVIYFNPRTQYNSDVFFSTCPDGRSAATTPAGGGFTELQNLSYAPGKSAWWRASNMLLADFEFGNLKIAQQVDIPPAAVNIPLSPNERSCPYSIAIHDSLAFVTGREGVAGTSTANCNNWKGVWKVDLVNQLVVDFLPLGTKLRDVKYGSDDQVYVSDFEEDKIHVINPGSMTLSRSISVGDGPVGFAIDALASKLMVTNWNSNKLQYYDLASDSKIGEVESGGVHPVDVYLSGNRAFVLNFGEMMGNVGGSLQAFSIP